MEAPENNIDEFDEDHEVNRDSFVEFYGNRVEV